ncbi:MAG: response regulator transcription factor [Erysipelotrichaceae bacterium]|nr:response regulator transcription factor [Erysipelotrichaceae bacterium]
MKKICIIEDDENIREIETYALKNAGYDVLAFSCAGEFRESREPFDLLVLDIMLPDIDGMTLLKQLRSSRATASLPVIMVTAKTSEIDIVKGLDSGADDYITKPFSLLEFVSRVKSLLRRSSGSTEKELFSGNILIDDSRRTVTVNEEVIGLTYKEYELLKYLVLNEGIVLSREKIMSAVWDTDYLGGSRTMDAHIKSLRQKLKEEGERIRTIRNVGFVLNAHEEKDQH